MEISVNFCENKVVEAEIGGHTVRTDQKIEDGGGGTAPSPSQYFLASIAACAGFYVMQFCRERNIPTDGVTVCMKTSRNEKTRLLDPTVIEIGLPPDFPAKYESAVVRAADQCWVKKQIHAGIDCETKTVR
jgi:ribosomal protein S12 methylthiotransferase accessory factor